MYDKFIKQAIEGMSDKLAKELLPHFNDNQLAIESRRLQTFFEFNMQIAKKRVKDEKNGWKPAPRKYNIEPYEIKKP